MLERDTADLKESAFVPPKILLTETVRWPVVALLAVGLAKVGSHVSAICPNHHPLLKTRAVRQIFHYSGLRPLQSLIAAIEASDPDFIIPCDERAVGHLHELHAWACRQGSPWNKIADLIEKSLGPADSYPIVSNRYDFLKIARDEGLRVPDSEPVHSVADLKSWEKRHGFPWVLKADGTYDGLGVKIAQNAGQADRFRLELENFYPAARAIKRLCVNRDEFWFRPWWKGVKPAVLVQSYVHGRAANCGVLSWKGKMLAGIGVEVVGLKSPTGHATIVRVVESPEMMHCAERIARRLKLSGFFGLDFVIEETTGLPYLLEINPRPTRLSCLRLGKGRDMIAALYAQISGLPLQEAPPVTQKNMIAYFPDAWASKSEFLESSFHDAPEGEPDLLQELRKPWPRKTLLWHMLARADQIKLLWRH